MLPINAFSGPQKVKYLLVANQSNAVVGRANNIDANCPSKNSISLFSDCLIMNPLS